jgi:uncharacterized protein (DUF2249 family)
MQLLTSEATMTLATASTTIDARSLAPRERESTIVAAFRALDFGDVLEIVNDRDPKPLYYQFQVEAPGDFSWVYVQTGPQVWRVDVQKLTRAHGTGDYRCHLGGCA